MNHLLEIAIEMAVKAHAGMLDKSGQPYILHPLRVMMAQTSIPARIAAVLHDVIEDTEVTIDQLRQAGLPEDSLTAIALLTHQANEPYEQYIDNLKENPIARAVKLADLRDNMDVLRLPGLTKKDLERLEKYHRSYEFLTNSD